MGSILSGFLSVVQTSPAPGDSELLKGRDHDLLMTMPLPQPSRLLELGLSFIDYSFTFARMQIFHGGPLCIAGLIMGRTARARWVLQTPGTIRILTEQGLGQMCLFIAQLDAF